jgi:hypothetical protein
MHASTHTHAHTHSHAHTRTHNAQRTHITHKRQTCYTHSHTPHHTYTRRTSPINIIQRTQRAMTRTHTHARTPHAHRTPRQTCYTHNHTLIIHAAHITHQHRRTYAATLHSLYPSQPPRTRSANKNTTPQNHSPSAIHDGRVASSPATNTAHTAPQYSSQSKTHHRAQSTNCSTTCVVLSVIDSVMSIADTRLGVHGRLVTAAHMALRTKDP